MIREQLQQPGQQDPEPGAGDQPGTKKRKGFEL